MEIDCTSPTLKFEVTVSVKMFGCTKIHNYEMNSNNELYFRLEVYHRLI